MIKNTQYIDDLIKLCDEAKNINPVRKFTFKNLDELKTVAKAIYIIEEIDGDKEKTFNDFKNYKLSNKRSCPKINKASNLLYVGSSTTNIKNRIKQHLGDGHEKTYALQLKHWFKGKYQITILEYDKDIQIEILQIIEDNLSHNLKPAFGKMGGNSK